MALFFFAVFGLIELASGVRRGMYPPTGMFDNAPPMATVLMLGYCAACGYLYASQVVGLLCPKIERLGSALAATSTVLAGGVGLVVPFLALHRLVLFVSWLGNTAPGPAQSAGSRACRSGP